MANSLGRALLPYCILTAVGTGRGLFFPFPTFQSEGKSMIASNFPLFAAKGIFDLYGRIYAKSGWDLSSVPFSARETGHGVNEARPTPPSHGVVRGHAES